MSGQPSKHVLKVSVWVVPLMPAECSKLMMAAARLPACRLPAKSQLDLPRVVGLSWFSTHLFEIGTSPSLTK